MLCTMRLLLLLFFCGLSEGQNLRLFLQNALSPSPLRFTPFLKEIEVVSGPFPLQGTRALVPALASLPLRMIHHQNHLKIMLPSDLLYQEGPGYRATLLIPRTPENTSLMNRFSSSFHRQKLRFEASREYLIINLEGEIQYGMEALLEAHREIVRAFQIPVLDLNFNRLDWVRISEDRLWLQGKSYERW